MNKMTILVGLLMGLGLLASPAMADSFDGTQTLICAVVDIVECRPGGECSKVLGEDVDFPDFFRINFKDKEIRTSQSGKEKRKTSIENMEQIDGKLIIQGAEDGREDARDGLGWSMAIDQENGKMVLTGSGSEVGFVVFGACTVP